VLVDEPFLQLIAPVLANVAGISAVVLGGSRVRGTAKERSDYDVGLYFSRLVPLDTHALAAALRTVVDDPQYATVTPIGEWGPWIVGGGWLQLGGRKLDLLYREVEAVDRVIAEACEGVTSMHYQPGHPHGFCSAHWMGEVALCRPLHDPLGVIARLKSKTAPYPRPLRDALIRRFRWEVQFSIENAELAVARSEQTHIVGCAYRALCCLAQVLYARNERYLINEKGALAEAAAFPLTIANLSARVEAIWRSIGLNEHGVALAELRRLDADLQSVCT